MKKKMVNKPKLILNILLAVALAVLAALFVYEQIDAQNLRNEIIQNGGSGVDLLGAPSAGGITALYAVILSFVLSFYFNFRYFLLSSKKSETKTVFNILIAVTTVLWFVSAYVLDSLLPMHYTQLIWLSAFALFILLRIIYAIIWAVKK